METKDQFIDLLLLAELQSSEAEFIRSARGNWVEEVSLIDIELVIDSVNVIRADGFLQVLQGLQVRDLSESDEVVIEEIDSSGRPSSVLDDLDSQRFGIDSSEVNSHDVIHYGLVHSESILDWNEINSIDWIF